MAEMVKHECNVTKEVYELGLALKGMVEATKTALDDGFQAGTDLPAIVLSSVGNLTTAVQGIEKVGDEFKNAPVEAVLGALLPVVDAVKVFVKKDDAPAS